MICRFSLVLSFIFLFALCSKTSVNTTRSPAPEPEPPSIVDKNGLLQVDGNRIVNKNNDPFSVRGMSLFWSQWMGKFYNAPCVQWLADDWKCTVVRAALGISTDGYLDNPETELRKIKDVITACIDEGIYVIVDWHDHHGEAHSDEAVAFFSEIAGLYGRYPHVIYEIYNEPLQVSWSNTVKPYAEKVIKAIREKDPDNLIILGTPTWSQDVEIAAEDPIDDPNVAYVVHFYAGTHQQFLRNKCTRALNLGVALFASEWGACESNGNGPLFLEETDKWIAFMDSMQISWCNWSVADKIESSAALKPNANPNGGWSDNMLTESGRYVRQKIIMLNSRDNDQSESSD